MKEEWLSGIAAFCAAIPAVAETVNPAAFGFLPGASAATNAVALQRALDGGKRTVEVTKAGVYGLDRTVWLDNDTRLVFGPGVVLQKRAPYLYVLANRSLANRTWNTNIWVEGLTLDINKCTAEFDPESPAFGNRGQLCFFNIRNLTLRGFTTLNLFGLQYGLHISRFENVVLDGFEIRGAKDGVHFNAGRKFVVRNGILETGDDGIALNAEDWISSAPVLGDIEDGLIENVSDVGHGQSGFCRLLTGAWVDWHDGIRLQRGDTVRYGKNVYRIFMPYGLKEYVSRQAPKHTAGLWADSSGLKFLYLQSDGILSANIRNVTFRNVYLRSPRIAFMANWATRPDWDRPIHPEVAKENYPVCEVSLENVASESPAPMFFGDQSMTLWLYNVTKTRGPLFSMKRGSYDMKVKLYQDGVSKTFDGKEWK